MNVRLPDGTIIQNVPDGTTKADLAAKLKANGMAVPAEWMQAEAPAPQPSLAERAGSALREIPRQVGLTARYGIEGVGQALQPFTEPIRQLVVNPIARMVQPTTLSDTVTGKQPVTAASTGDAASRLADFLGLPTPRDANERVIGDAARTVASAGALSGAAGALSRGASGVVGNALEQLAARPGTQLAGAAGAGAAGGSVREAGGGPVEQFAAALAGGLAGGVAADRAAGAVDAARRALTPRATQLQQADHQIQLVLERSGVDWSQVPERVRQGMREEVASALNTGQPLNERALQRLLVFQRTGTTPTVGMLTQNPGQITREMNLAKTGASSTDAGLQRLPGLQNQNTATLLRNLDEAGAAAAPSAEAVGERGIGGLTNYATARRNEISSLYSAARDNQGRSLPLEPGTFTRRANELLDYHMVGGALPGDVARTLNAVARGEMPLTVEIAEQLKTRIGALQRASSDGSARMALRLVRQALDETPLADTAGRVPNPGNLPAVRNTLPSAQTAPDGQAAIEAFNRARAANRTYMQALEANPALAQVDEAIAAVRDNPQLRSVNDVVGTGDFVRKFVTGRSASPGEVGSLLDQVGPEGARALRQYVVRYLRDAATNNTDDITKFSDTAYRRALRDIGDEKLGVLFTPEEVQRLRDVGEAAKYMKAQPDGSAVNNSNSGALMLGRGLDTLDRIAGKIPFGMRDVIRGQIQGMQQTQVLSPRNALTLAVEPAASPLRINPLVAAAAATPAQARDEKRRH